MPTVIDSLLVVLGLDSSGFEKGRKQTGKGLKDAREDVDKTGKTYDDFGKKTGAAFSKVRNEAVGLFLAFQGASGVKDFIGNMITGDAATGRLAGNLGMLTNTLSAYELAVKSVNGSAEGIDAFFQKMATARDNAAMGKLPDNAVEFSKLGITGDDLKEGPAHMLGKMADAVGKFREKYGAPMAHTLLQNMGIDEGTINLLQLGTDKINEIVEARKKDAAATEADAKAAEKLQAKTAELANKISGLLRPEVYKLVNNLVTLTDAFAKVVPQGVKVDGVFQALLGTAILVGGPFTVLAASIMLAVTNLDKLEKAYFATTLATHGFIGGRDTYDALKKAGVKTPADIDSYVAGTYEEDMRAHLKGKSGSYIATYFAERERIKAGGTPISLGGPAPAAGGGGSTDAISSGLARAGFSAEQSKGIMAGIQAETGGNYGMSSKGAFGIGQWRGPRAEALYARYHTRAPSIAQQTEFLISELNGGDAGGKKVKGQTSVTGTLVSYLRDFMRPQGKNGEHMQDLVNDIIRGYKALHLTPPAMFAGGSRGGTVNIGSIQLGGVRDAHGFARALPNAMQRRSMVAQSDGALD